MKRRAIDIIIAISCTGILITVRKRRPFFHTVGQVVRRGCECHEGRTDYQKNQSYSHINRLNDALVGYLDFPELHEDAALGKKYIKNQAECQNYHYRLKTAQDIFERDLRNSDTGKKKCRRQDVYDRIPGDKKRNNIKYCTE